MKKLNTNATASSGSYKEIRISKPNSAFVVDKIILTDKQRISLSGSTLSKHLPKQKRSVAG